MSVCMYIISLSVSTRSLCVCETMDSMVLIGALGVWRVRECAWGGMRVPCARTAENCAELCVYFVKLFVIVVSCLCDVVTCGV